MEGVLALVLVDYLSCSCQIFESDLLDFRAVVQDSEEMFESVLSSRLVGTMHILP